ncbi:hypothetical protein CO683_00905 [Bradyrhizobium ottawaense]|uniref:hypothetical protein n=1 Tax=Bradyrhizobium ottawaense TaxID=931866 RepID=UPI000BE95438|nr:hypothetical protein [Bradyrhizobium ottawaense]PDT71750.1 hypothetical protein CO683_00905 [Bradyrhizobium ottawaense]
MPQAKRRATFFLGVIVAAIFLLSIALILLMTRPARALDQIPCWKAKALLAYAGSPAEAEKIALQQGYTKSEIAEVRRRCGL